MGISSRNWLYQGVQDVVDSIYPRCCAGCDEPLAVTEQHICSNCLSDLPIVQKDDSEIALRIAGRLPISSIYSFLYYRKKGTVQRIIEQFKYKNDPELGAFLGRIYGRSLLSKGIHFDNSIFIPVPLHPKKLRSRGFNQSTEFAKGVSSICGGHIVEDLIIRSTNNDTQTSKSREERWKNVNTVFTINKKINTDLTNQPIILVDDVLTTGATLESCGSLLTSFRIPSLSVMTLALAVK